MSQQKPEIQTPMTTEFIQRCLDENQTLIFAIIENQKLGKLKECQQYQNRLQQNLIQLATIADNQPNKQTQNKTNFRDSIGNL